MNSHNVASITNPETKGPVVNGVPTGQLLEVIDLIQQDAEMAQFQFRLHNHWQGGSINRSCMNEWFALGDEQSRNRQITRDADEPDLIAGQDTAPTPVEYVLHALISCLTTTMVYHASVQGIAIESAQSRIEGDIDVRGFFGLSDEVRKGFNAVRVVMRVKSEADAETLRNLAMYSAVYDIVANSLPVELVLEKG
jgi:uncharacterized OsmC-like protein